jgi:hypothetical protein
MVIFKYINKKDNSLLGYHLSTFCQIGTKEQAKQYGCSTDDEIESQKEIIQNNFNHVINSTEENDKDRFISLLPIKKAYFEGLTQEDIDLQHEVI